MSLDRRIDARRARRPHADWTVVFPLALLFGLGLAALLPPLIASAMNSLTTPWPAWPLGRTTP